MKERHEIKVKIKQLKEENKNLEKEVAQSFDLVNPSADRSRIHRIAVNTHFIRGLEWVMGE